MQKSSLHITTSPLALLPNSYFRSKCKIVLKPIYPNSVTSLYCGGCSFNDKWAKLAHETWQAHDVFVLWLALRSRGAATETNTQTISFTRACTWSLNCGVCQRECIKRQTESVLVEYHYIRVEIWWNMISGISSPTWNDCRFAWHFLRAVLY